VGRVACIGGDKMLKKMRHIKTKKGAVFERAVRGKIKQTFSRYVIEGVDRIELAQYVVY
jgi:hypothetical protein